MGNGESVPKSNCDCNFNEYIKKNELQNSLSLYTDNNNTKKDLLKLQTDFEKQRISFFELGDQVNGLNNQFSNYYSKQEIDKIHNDMNIMSNNSNDFLKKDELQNILSLYTNTYIRPNYVNYNNNQQYYSIQLPVISTIMSNGKEKIPFISQNNVFFDYNETTRIFTSKLKFVISASILLNLSQFLAVNFNFNIVKNNSVVFSYTLPAYSQQIIVNKWTNASDATLIDLRNDLGTSQSCKNMCASIPECVGWSENSSGQIPVCYTKRKLNNLNSVGDGYNTVSNYGSTKLEAIAFFTVDIGDTFYLELTRSCTINNGSYVQFSVLKQ